MLQACIISWNILPSSSAYISLRVTTVYVDNLFGSFDNVTINFECILISGVNSVEHTISLPPITFIISNTVHFNTLFQNGVIRGLLLAFQYIGQNNNKKGGVVVNIASMCGLDPFELASIHCGIKHGVVGLTRSFGVGRLCFVSSYNFAKWSGVKRVGLPYTEAHLLHFRSFTKYDGLSGAP